MLLDYQTAKLLSDYHHTTMTVRQMTAQLSVDHQNDSFVITDLKKQTRVNNIRYIISPRWKMQNTANDCHLNVSRFSHPCYRYNQFQRQSKGVTRQMPPLVRCPFRLLWSDDTYE